MGNLVPVASGTVESKLANGEDKPGDRSIMSHRIGMEFTQFISLSLGEQQELKGIEKFQDTLQSVLGIGERKKKEKMQVTILCVHADPEEVAAIELGFKRAGDRFTDITGKSPFIINFRGLDQGDGEGHPIFLKVK